MALGNKEHPGRTRGAGVYVTWAKWFQADSGSYRSRKRAKDDRDAKLREEIRESIRDEVEDRVRAVSQRFEERIRELEISNHLQAPAPTVLASPPKHPSSCASNPTPNDDNRSPIDDIQVIIIISGMLDPLIGLLE